VLLRGAGRIGAAGTLVCRTGAHIGRSPNDKFVVLEPSGEANVARGVVNPPVEASDFDAVYRGVTSYLEVKDLNVIDVEP
jgi:phosphoenolpyruvate carboxykinase (ATP)